MVTTSRASVVHLSASGLRRISQEIPCVGRREVHVFSGTQEQGGRTLATAMLKRKESQELAAARRRLRDMHLQKHARPFVTMALPEMSLGLVFST